MNIVNKKDYNIAHTNEVKKNYIPCEAMYYVLGRVLEKFKNLVLKKSVIRIILNISLFKKNMD